MQFDRELACDLAAVSDSPKGRAKYAECLIHFARLHSSQDPRNWGIDFAASSSHLQARVHAILAGNKKSPPWLVGLRIAGGAVLLAGFVSIAPSMEVLLSFVQQRVTQPSAAAISITPPTAQARVKATRRSRLSNRLSPPGDDTAIANAAEAPQVMDLSAGQSTESPDSTRSGGPQLLHRDSTAAAKGSKQQIVIPIDDPSGQVDKTGDHDHDQAVQQAATAATVLRRISALDRH